MAQLFDALFDWQARNGEMYFCGTGGVNHLLVCDTGKLNVLLLRLRWVEPSGGSVPCFGGYACPCPGTSFCLRGFRFFLARSGLRLLVLFLGRGGEACELLLFYWRGFQTIKPRTDARPPHAPTSQVPGSSGKFREEAFGGQKIKKT